MEKALSDGGEALPLKAGLRTLYSTQPSSQLPTLHSRGGGVGKLTCMASGTW